MNNYPTRRESSDLEQYVAEYYPKSSTTEISFLTGVKRLVWCFMALGGVCIICFLCEAYESSPERWNNLAFWFVVGAMTILLFTFAGICIVAWANYAGVSVIPIKEYEPIPNEHEWQENREDEKPIFPRQDFVGKRDTPEFEDAVLEYYDTLKYMGKYTKTPFIEAVYGGKAQSYFKDAERILNEHGRYL